MRRTVITAILSMMVAAACSAFPADRIVSLVPTLDDFELRGPVKQVDYLPFLDWVAEDNEYRWQPPGEPNYYIYGFDRHGRRIRRATTLWAREGVVGKRAEELSSDARWTLSERGLIEEVREMAGSPVITVEYEAQLPERRVENGPVTPEVELTSRHYLIMETHILILRDDGFMEHFYYRDNKDMDLANPTRLEILTPSGTKTSEIDRPGWYRGASGEKIYKEHNPGWFRDERRYENSRLVETINYELGELESETKYEYNERDFVRREILTYLTEEADGSVTRGKQRIREYEYEYDERGNWIEKRLYRVEEEGGRVPVWARQRMIEYYE